MKITNFYYKIFYVIDKMINFNENIIKKIKKFLPTRIFFLSILLLSFSLNGFSQDYQKNIEEKKNYIQLSGNLFQDVQLSGIFKDSKTFVDAVPLKEPELIIKLYDSLKLLPDFDLAQFISINFKIPVESDDIPSFPENLLMDTHIEYLWIHLLRKPENDNKKSTLIQLQFPYIVPGGRFREIYYWDSYFTILGLLADNKISDAENMVKNFAFLLRKFHMIPNGNRVYYLTRSQPPFFALMIDIICRYKNDYQWGLQFLDALETEYNFWMNGLRNRPNENDYFANERVVFLNQHKILNRYYDFDTIPREESYKEDYNLALRIADSLRPEFYRNIRAAAESGWDFSSRWFKDGESLITINTTDILPVDLNSLLYFLEERISFFYDLKNDKEKSSFYKDKAERRKKLINEIFWNEEKEFYFDYNWKERKHTEVYSLAATFPFYFGIAEKEYAEEFAEKLEDLFLKPGGLTATINETGEQWDAPNGWAPLQWMTIKGLKEYGNNKLADEIKKRWLSLNENVFKRTDKLVEKYNVINLELIGGGGEYPLQDGFGWTNGVAAALISNFDEKFLLQLK